MKTGLISAIAIAVLLIGSLLYWKTRPVEGAAPEVKAPATSTTAAPEVALSTEAAGSEAGARATEPLEAPPRSAAAPAPIAPPALDSDLASPAGTTPEVTPPITGSLDELQRADNQIFEKRYEGKSLEQRRAAQESLRLLLYGNQEGDLGKGQALTDEQIADFKREIEWLSTHEAP